MGLCLAQPSDDPVPLALDLKEDEEEEDMGGDCAMSKMDRGLGLQVKVPYQS
jgi:hypothetical protein